MKNKTLRILQILIGFFGMVHMANAQPQIDWARNYGGSEGEIAYAIEPTTDGGSIVVGSSWSSDGDLIINNGSEDWLILKLDVNGDIEWHKSLGSQQSERATDVKQTNDNGYIVTGNLSDDGTNPNHNGTNDFWVIKLDSDGEIEWEQLYGTGASYSATSILLTADQGYIVSGHSSSQGKLYKIDAQGNIEWNEGYGGSEIDRFTAIQQTTDLGYVITGYSESNDGDVGFNNGERDIWVLKIDVAGEIEWSKVFGGSAKDEAHGVQQTDEGNFIVAGWTRSNNGDIENNYGSTDVWVLKLDPLGNLLWEKNYGGQGTDEGNSLEKISTGGYLISGSTRSDEQDVSEISGIEDIWIIKINEEGSLEWEKSIGGTGTNISISYDIKATTNGQIFATGNTNGGTNDFNSNNGGFDIFVAKLSLMTSGLEEAYFQSTMMLYPNPNSGDFTINNSKISNSVNIKIHDITGQVIYTKSDTNLPIDVNKLSRGIYIVSINSKNNNYREKIIVH